MIRRREFIRLLGGTAIGWPLAARAQQNVGPIVGFLHSQTSDGFREPLREFRQALRESGYIEGDNLSVEYRWAHNRSDLRLLATDLVSRGVAVLAAMDTPSALAAKEVIAPTAVVFMTGVDPVAAGLVASLARPGGNATGINFFLAEIGAKRLGLLRELLVAANRVAVLVNPANIVSTSAARRELEPAARAMGLQIEFYEASTSREIDAAFAVLVRAQPDALFVAPDTFFVSRRVQLIGLAARHLLPATYPERDSVEAGGLMSYGTNVAEMYRQVGGYAGRILKGAKPADLPVVQTSTFELIINVQTARLLGIEVPPMLLARADEVIE